MLSSACSNAAMRKPCSFKDSMHERVSSTLVHATVCVAPKGRFFNLMVSGFRGHAAEVDVFGKKTVGGSEHGANVVHASNVV